MTSKPLEQSILILITGGTFDKTYDEIHGCLFFKDSHLPEMLQLGRSRLPVKIETLMMIDSLDMVESHRLRLVEACQSSHCHRIVITHGTDTMADTARFLNDRVFEKTVVLTGAMVPYSFGSSDGLFNLGSALAFVQVLEHGVFVAMNGRIFPAGQVVKNKATGIFEELA